jgi:ribose/xylose/arabinose/galactoside ABC-type transport system permease subunit
MSGEGKPMTDPVPIFRAEAMRGPAGPLRRSVAAWTGPRHRAGTVQTGPWWMTGTYWILLVLLAAGLAAGLLIKVGSQPLIVTLVTGLTSGGGDG